MGLYQAQFFWQAQGFPKPAVKRGQKASLKSGKFIGYLPEVVCPATAGIILDTFTEAGYKYYFLAVGIIMLIGIVGIMIWNRSMKKQKALNK